MALHDDYARRTPWEAAFTTDRASQLVGQVDDEATQRGLDASDPASFVTLASVASFVGEVQADEGEPAATRHFGALAFHGASWIRSGRSTYILSLHVARLLIDGAPAGDPEPVAPAGYLQLPQHLLWLEPDGETPQSVDGLFWTVDRRGTLHTLLIVGVRPDRPGLEVVPLPAAPVADGPTWVSVDARGDGTDFQASFPGSDIDGLCAIKTAGEALKLLARFFAYVESVDDSLEDVEAASSSGPPEPSTLPFKRVVLRA